MIIELGLKIILLVLVFTVPTISYCLWKARHTIVWDEWVVLIFVLIVFCGCMYFTYFY